MKKTNSTMPDFESKGVKKTKSQVPAGRTLKPAAELPKVSVTEFLTTYFTLLSEVVDNPFLWEDNYAKIRELHARIDGVLDIKVDNASLDEVVDGMAGSRKPAEAVEDQSNSYDEESSYSY